MPRTRHKPTVPKVPGVEPGAVFLVVDLCDVEVLGEGPTEKDALQTVSEKIDQGELSTNQIEGGQLALYKAVCGLEADTTVRLRRK